MASFKIEQKEGTQKQSFELPYNFETIKKMPKTKFLKLPQHTQNQFLADLIKEYVTKREMASDMRIYFNGKAYDSEGYGDNLKWVTKEDLKGSEFFEYANDKTVSVSTEGEFYNVINMYDVMGDFAYNTKRYDEFDKLIRKYGYYFELGNAWNFSLYKE
jgi:hypothetical protein